MSKTSKSEKVWVLEKADKKSPKYGPVWTLWCVVIGWVLLAVATLHTIMRNVVLTGVFERNLHLVQNSGGYHYIPTLEGAGVLAGGVKARYDTFPIYGAWLSTDGERAILGVPVEAWLGRLGAGVAVLVVVVGLLVVLVGRKIRARVLEELSAEGRTTKTWESGLRVLEIVLVALLYIAVGAWFASAAGPGVGALVLGVLVLGRAAIGGILWVKRKKTSKRDRSVK